MIFSKLFNKNKVNIDSKKQKNISGTNVKAVQDNSSNKTVINNNHYYNAVGEGFEFVPTELTFDDGSKETIYVAKKIESKKDGK